MPKLIGIASRDNWWGSQVKLVIGLRPGWWKRIPVWSLCLEDCVTHCARALMSLLDPCQGCELDLFSSCWHTALGVSLLWNCLGWAALLRVTPLPRTAWASGWSMQGNRDPALFAPNQDSPEDIWSTEPLTESAQAPKVTAEAWSVQSLPQMWTPKALCWGCPACWSLQHLLPCRPGFLLLNSQQAEGSCDRVLTNGRWAEWSGLGSISGVGGSVCEVVQTAHEGDLPEWKINFPCVKLLRFGICFGLCKHDKLSYQTLAYPIFSMALAFLFQNLSNSRGRSSHKLMSGYTINICCFSYVCLS